MTDKSTSYYARSPDPLSSIRPVLAFACQRLPCPALLEAFTFACLPWWLPLPPCAVVLCSPAQTSRRRREPPRERVHRETQHSRRRAVRRLPPTEVSSLVPTVPRPSKQPSALHTVDTAIPLPPVCDSRPFCLPAGPSIRHRHHAATEVLLRPPSPGMLMSPPLLSAHPSPPADNPHRSWEPSNTRTDHGTTTMQQWPWSPSLPERRPNPSALYPTTST